MFQLLLTLNPEKCQEEPPRQSLRWAHLGCEARQVRWRLHGEAGFALSIHTTVAVNAAVLKVSIVDERTAELSQKYVSLCMS